MTVNGVGFFSAATLVVVTAAGCVAAPRPRQNVAAGLACLVATALLCAVSGAYVLGLGLLVVPAAAGWLVWWQAAEHRARLLDETVQGPAHLWQIGAGVAVVGGLLLAIALALHGDQFPTAAEPAAGSVFTVLHWREPVGAVVAAVLALFGVAGVVMIAAESEDERAFEAAAEERRRKQERLQRRRADREAARRARTAGPR